MAYGFGRCAAVNQAAYVVTSAKTGFPAVAVAWAVSVFRIALRQCDHEIGDRANDRHGRGQQPCEPVDAVRVSEVIPETEYSNDGVSDRQQDKPADGHRRTFPQGPKGVVGGVLHAVWNTGGWGLDQPPVSGAAMTLLCRFHAGLPLRTLFPQLLIGLNTLDGWSMSVACR